MEKKNEEKRKKFHDVLLNLYLPPPLSPPPPPSQQFDEETLMLENGDMSFNLDPASDAEEEKESCAIDATDYCESKKLSRAQRKRIRKRKLKEAGASVPRKIIGPVFPSNYDDSRNEHCSGDNNMKNFSRKQ